jgi:hypothetical protein
VDGTVETGGGADSTLGPHDPHEQTSLNVIKANFVSEHTGNTSQSNAVNPHGKVDVVFLELGEGEEGGLTVRQVGAMLCRAGGVYGMH